MKTIRTIINKTVCGAAALAVAFGAVSCDDMLDTKPQGVFTSEQIGEVSFSTDFVILSISA